MKIKRFASFGSALLLSLASLFVLAPLVHAVPKTCVWTGSGSDAKFSTSANWSSCGGAAPLAGDTLSFPALGTKQAPINDTVLAYDAVQFTGASGDCTDTPYDWYNITGTQPLSVASTISNNMTGNCSSAQLDLSITATGNLAISGSSAIQIGTADTSSALSLGTNTLTISASTIIYDKLSGSGAINANNSLTIDANSSGYSGTVTQNVYSLYLYSYSGSAIGTGSLVINDVVDVGIFVCDGATFANNITLNGESQVAGGDNPSPKLTTGYLTCPRPSNDGQGGGGCDTDCPSYDEYYSGGSIPTEGSLTLSGTLTLGADTTMTTYSKTANVTGTVNGGKKLTLLPGGGGALVLNSSSNNSATPNGTYKPDPINKTVSDSVPSHTVDVWGNYWLTIDGVRGAVTVESGAKLLGSGTVGALTVMSGGTSAPGHSPGCMTTGNLKLNGSLDEEIGGTTACSGYDQLKVTGTVDVTNGTLNTSLYNGFKPAKGNSFTIIDNDGSDAVIGAFSGRAEGATFTVSGYVFKISYKGGTGNDVVLTVQSIPGSPDTGFNLVKANPLTSLVVTMSAAAGISLTARRYRKITGRR